MKGNKLSIIGWLNISAIFSILVIVLMLAFIHIDRETQTVTIIKKRSMGEYHFIYAKTDDGRTVVFKNTDTWLEWKFNSADTQAKIIIGEKYKVKTYGWRIKVFSMYPNIVKTEWVRRK